MSGSFDAIHILQNTRRKEPTMKRHYAWSWPRPLSISLLLVVLGATALAQTTVPPGNVSGTWTVLGSPYRITGDIIVPNDSSLVIEPGVTVEFQGHYELLVNGRLLAIGTVADTILFTVKDTTGWSNRDTTLGGWKHIRLFEPSATNDSTILAYCRIEHGKAIGPNWPFNHGGAISIVGFNKVRISNCLIVNNMSGGQEGPAGGGVGVTSCDILITNNTIAYNYSSAGGGIHLSHSNSALLENTIRGNSATGNGGGIEILGDDTRPAVVSLVGDTLADNQAGPGAGGINAVDVDSLVLQSVTFLGNHANWGGGIGTFNSTLFLSDCSLIGNRSDWLGGGIAADFCDLSISGTEFLLNVSLDAAGAMHNDHCTVLLTNADISENTSGCDTLAGPAGGINAYATTLDVQDCQFQGNVTSGNGGAINGDSVTLTVTGTVITDNTARFAGGGMHLNRSIVEIRNSSVTYNAVGTDSIVGVGGGLRTVDSRVKIRDSEIDNNSTTGSGGGIATLSDDLIVDGTSLSSNQARWRGGGLVITGGTIALNNADLIGNVAGNDTIAGLGGGLDAAWSDITLAQCTVSGDTATTGAGMNLNNCDLYILEVLFDHNVARADGGALYYVADSTLSGLPFAVRIQDSQFEANSAANQSAGPRIVQSSTDSNQVTVTIDGCAFMENRSRSTTSLRLVGAFRNVSLINSVFLRNSSSMQASGAGFTGGWGTVANCLFAGNTAGSDSMNASGTGLSVIQDARVNVVNCTFADNEANAATALSMRTGGQAWLTNCIIWGNTGLPISLVTASWPTGCHLWVNHSLVEHGAGSINISDSLSNLHWGVGNLDEDPQFADSASGDYHLTAMSHCINAGIDSIEVGGRLIRAPNTDLEGNPRSAPAGTQPDMGAYEEGVTNPNGIHGDGPNDIPLSSALFQNYPNPFNPRTTIRYAVGGSQHVVQDQGIGDARGSSGSGVVRLVVYDVLGREVAVLVNEKKTAGYHQFTFDANALASGAYIYRLSVGDFVENRIMILVR